MRTHKQDSPEFTDEELYEGIISDFEDFEDIDFNDASSYPNTQGGQFSDKAVVVTAIEIEKFVRSIASGSETGFKENGNRLQFPQINNTLSCWDVQPLGVENYWRLGQFASIYNPILEYSPEIMLFIGVFYEMGLGNTQLPQDHNQLAFAMNQWCQGAFIFNTLVSCIRDRYKSHKFSEKQFARTQQAKRNFDSCSEYTEAIFKHRGSRLLAIRVDLSYHRWARNGITLQTAQSHFERFLNNTHKNSIFKYQCGYIRKLEYGARKGYHFHLLMFFDGSQEQHDVHKAFEIGQYWSQVITKGAGHYYNCNQSKNRYKRLGIGRIEHDDQVMRSNLLYAIGYLCKSEQSVQVKDNSARVKSLVRGIMPKARSSKAGRPRRNTTRIVPPKGFKGSSQAGQTNFIPGFPNMQTGLI